MGQLGSVIAASAKPVQAYAARLLAGISREQFARLARPGGVIIHSNHPAWAFGHLARYPSRVLSSLGRPAGSTAAPESYEALFANGTECRDDAAGTIYPPMAEITRFCLEGYKVAIAAVAEATDDALLAKNPTEGRLGELFPILASMLNFYLLGHTQVHLGQVSAWRRAVGLPAV